MFCFNCGGSNPEGMRFCMHCGSKMDQIKKSVPRPSVMPDQRPEIPPVQPPVMDENRRMPIIKDKSRKNGRGAVVASLIIVILSIVAMVLALLNIIPSVSEWGIGIGNKKKEAVKFEGEGFDSPEDAALAYITALNNSDINEVLSTFAIENYVDNYNTKAHIAKEAKYAPIAAFNETYELSDGRDFDREVRIEARKAYIMYMLYRMIDIYTSDHQGMVIALTDEEDIDEMLRKIEKTDFLSEWGKMEFDEFVDPDEISETYGSKRIRDSLKAYEKIYGCEEVVNVCARVEIDGDDYYQFFECCKYNDKWYIATPAGHLSEVVVTEPEYFGLILCDEIL